MKLRIKALRSLRWNYKHRGVWVWLKGRQRIVCPNCQGTKRVAQPERGWLWHFTCLTCFGHGKITKRGYQRILSEPGKVLAEQEQAAAGAAT